MHQSRIREDPSRSSIVFMLPMMSNEDLDFHNDYFEIESSWNYISEEFRP